MSNDLEKLVKLMDKTTCLDNSFVKDVVQTMRLGEFVDVVKSFDLSRENLGAEIDIKVTLVGETDLYEKALWTLYKRRGSQDIKRMFWDSVSRRFEYLQKTEPSIFDIHDGCKIMHITGDRRSIVTMSMSRYPKDLPKT